MNVRYEVHGADAVLLAFLDLKFDQESSAGRSVFRRRGNDAHIDVATLQIKPPQQLAVGFEAIRVVDVGGLQEREKRSCGGLDNVAQAIRRKGPVANELDRLDVGLVALFDLENEVNAAVRQFDNLWIDGDVEAATATINLDDPLYVGLHLRTRQRTALLGLNLKLELLVLDAAVAFERNAIDDRTLHHNHLDAAAGSVNAHVLK